MTNMKAINALLPIELEVCLVWIGQEGDSSIQHLTHFEDTRIK